MESVTTRYMTLHFFYIYDIPLKIVHLEMLNLVIALKLWARDWVHSAVKFYCDNPAVVQVVRTGKTRDNMLTRCLRNIWLITASHDTDLQIDHIQGRANKIADLLSRIYSPKTVNLKFLKRYVRYIQGTLTQLYDFRVEPCINTSAPRSLDQDTSGA